MIWLIALFALFAGQPFVAMMCVLIGAVMEVKR